MANRLLNFFLTNVSLVYELAMKIFNISRIFTEGKSNGLQGQILTESVKLFGLKFNLQTGFGGIYRTKVRF